MRLLVVNGPNLNLLGTREPDVYGSTTLAQLEEKIRDWGDALGVGTDLIQSNSEQELIESIHKSDHDGIVINPGAFTHTSRALADALAGVELPAVEVHISNIMQREPWRRSSVLTGVAVKSIYGRGPIGYRHALLHHVNRAAHQWETVPYGPHPDNYGDLRRAGRGLVVLVHGGFWRSEWALDTMESIAVDLARRGVNTWNIEYRRLGTGGGWPASAHDVLTALEFTPRLGLDHVPPTVIGHSAGGQLAVWAASRARPRVGRVIGLGAVTNLELHASTGMFGAVEARALLDGGAPARVDPGGVPLTLFHGDDDDLVSAEQPIEMANRGSADLVEVAEGHFALIDPSKSHWDRVLALITQS